MSEKYKVIDSQTATFITFTLVGWVDLFIRKVYTDILDESFEYCQKNKGLKIHGYVYMTSHIHLIVSSEEHPIQDIVRDFKKYTNKRLIETIISPLVLVLGNPTKAGACLSDSGNEYHSYLGVCNAIYPMQISITFH